MRRDPANVVVPVVMFLFTAGYLAAAHATIEGIAGRVPLLVGYTTLLLLAIDIAASSFGAKLSNSPKFQSGDPAISVGLTREVGGIACVVGCFLGIYLVGFYLAIPAYLFLSIAILGKQSLLSAITASLATCAAIYIVFDLLLGYPLFPGLLFS